MILDTRPVCRERELSLLSSLLSSEHLPSSLLVQGVEGVGKSCCLGWLASHLGLKQATVHCVEVYQPRLIFQAILGQLLPSCPQVDSLSDFLSCLGELDPREPVLLLLEGGERLREEGNRLLHTLLRLQEITDRNICTVIETRLSWSKVIPPEGLGTDPIRVEFPQYSREEVGTVLTKLLSSSDPSLPTPLLNSYTGMVLSVFYNVTRSLGELVHTCRQNLPLLTSHLAENPEGEVRKLWFSLEPHLRTCLSSVHSRETQAAATAPISRACELPFYSKYLLIAAFLASYNPAKTDKRFFVKHHGKQRKTSQSIKAKERLNSQLTGPKPFPLERLLAIFYNIVEEGVSPSAPIYAQVSSLARLGLITALGQDMMDQPKYKCSVDMQFIKTIARPMQFDIYKYLYDQA